jgi:hypothetical protein
VQYYLSRKGCFPNCHDERNRRRRNQHTFKNIASPLIEAQRSAGGLFSFHHTCPKQVFKPTMSPHWRHHQSRGRNLFIIRRCREASDQHGSETNPNCSFSRTGSPGHNAHYEDRISSPASPRREREQWEYRVPHPSLSGQRSLFRQK